MRAESSKQRKPGVAQGQPCTPKPLPSRARCYRIAAVIGIPLLILLMSEGLLRLAGYGYPSDFFLEREVNGRSSLIDNQAFGRRFFPEGLTRFPKPTVLPVEKPSGTKRIFVLGESAAMGDPEPRFGLPRMLQVLLQERFPAWKMEVVNASMVAINSHVILPIARDCARRRGDLWVIYMGNNEMIGPFGPISKFGAQTPPRPFIAASLAVKRTRVGQAMDTLVQRLRRGRQPPPEWEGMSLWEDQTLHPDAKNGARAYENFEHNLRDILEVGRSAGVPIILCTVATNVKDCAPFKSVHGGKCSDEELKAWQAAYDEGLALERQGKFTEARLSYQRALGLDRQFADLCFRAARCALALGIADEARSLFLEARDYDALQFRANSKINDILRRVALSYRGQGVFLLDAEEHLANASPQRLVGSEFFYEHVHLSPPGNYLLARAVAERAIEALDGLTEEVGARGVGAEGWVSEKACLDTLGFTDWNRYQILDTIRKRMEVPPFTRQVNYEESMMRILNEIQQCRSSTKPFQMQRASLKVAEAVVNRPEDPDLRWNLAELLNTIHDVRGAEEQWRAVIRLLPHSHLPYYNLGRLLESNERAGEALDLYRQCLGIRADFFDARFALGSALCRQGASVEGLNHLSRAAEEQPRNSQVHLALGIALQQNNRNAEAVRHFREVLQLDPNNAQARQFIGSAGHAH